MNLKPDTKERIKQDLIKAGAIPREKKLTPRDDFYSKSLGEKNTPIPNIRF